VGLGWVLDQLEYALVFAPFVGLYGMVIGINCILIEAYLNDILITSQKNGLD
jgi:hypothetical protein